MPMQRDRYPADWPQISRAVRERADWRCEWPGCARKQGDQIIGRKGQPYSVVLTVAHLDHNPANCDLANLRAWCQEHHLHYDARHHAQSARRTRKRKLAEQARRLRLEQPELVPELLQEP